MNAASHSNFAGEAAAGLQAGNLVGAPRAPLAQQGVGELAGAHRGDALAGGHRPEALPVSLALEIA
jgi:hypothetical protein